MWRKFNSRYMILRRIAEEVGAVSRGVAGVGSRITRDKFGKMNLSNTVRMAEMTDEIDQIFIGKMCPALYLPWNVGFGHTERKGANWIQRKPVRRHMGGWE